MAAVTGSITRTLLSLPTLDLNDVVTYQLGAAFTAGEVTWRRQQVESIYIDGQVTVNRAKSNREMVVPILVRGATWDDIQTSMGVLDAAFFQDSFDFSFSIDGDVTTVRGETADRSRDYTHSLIHVPMAIVTYTFSARPTPIAGVL